MNFRHPWYPLVFALEKKLGRLAIPGFIRFLAVFTFMVVCIEYYYYATYSGPANEYTGYNDMLSFDADLIAEGKVWRLFSFILISPAPPSIIWGLVTMLIMWFINDALERSWGAFKVTLYVVSTIGLQIAALYIAPNNLDAVLSARCGNFLYASIFMATAAYLPNYEFRLFFIIPVKLKWIAVLVFALALFQTISFPYQTVSFMILIASFIPYAVVFIPNFMHRMAHAQKTAERRREFQSNQIDEDDVFHRCVKCGVTDHDNPEMDFRVASDDQEYCRNCRPEEATKEG